MCIRDRADPERSFNRGYTDYFFVQRKPGMVNMDSPKSMGKKVAVVKQMCIRDRIERGRYNSLPL